VTRTPDSAPEDQPPLSVVRAAHDAFAERRPGASLLKLTFDSALRLDDLSRARDSATRVLLFTGDATTELSLLVRVLQVPHGVRVSAELLSSLGRARLQLRRPGRPMLPFQGVGNGQFSCEVVQRGPASVLVEPMGTRAARQAITDWVVL
jgi:hypothetical protein